ncbi:MAG: hypothetical protein IJS22_03495 [Lachnospiraceae bacterium]|nr:hypothetical protein [Lachnospiraceae bacterium]
MKSLSNDISNNIVELKYALQIINCFLEKAPEGRLTTYSKNGVTYYKNVVGTPGTAIRATHLGKGASELKMKLAKKEYYLRLKPAVESQLANYTRMLKLCNDSAVYDTFGSLSEEKKNLVVPLFESAGDHESRLAKEAVMKWRARKWEFNTSHPERLRYETAKGELRRSKAEVMISDYLDRIPELEYLYEPRITINGRTLCPDFVIINLITGKIFYLEHFGGMHIEGYAEKMVRKIRDYETAGLKLGIDVFYTFETEELPLRQKDIEFQVESMLTSKK